MTDRAHRGKMLLLLALAAGWTCARGPGIDGTARASIPERVACGLTGLQTGRGRGFIVHADGQVEAWAGRTMAEGVESKGSAPAGAVEALWEAIGAAHLAGRTEQAVATTAAFVQVDSAEQSHRVSWAVGPGAPAVDTTLTHVFDLCHETAGAAR